jgi:L-fuconolactonase
VEHLLATLDAAGVQRAVVVQPSVDGSDHGTLLHALARAPERLIAIALAEPDDPAGLRVLEGLVGDTRVRGVRVPLIRMESDWEPWADAVWELAADAGWVVGALLEPSQLDGLDRQLTRHPGVPVAIDHLARLDLAPERRTALDRLIALAAHPAAHVKLSALAKLSGEPAPYRRAWPEAEKVLDAYGAERVLWGSDYPHVLRDGAYAQSLDAARAFVSATAPEAAGALFSATAIRLFWGAR